MAFQIAKADGGTPLRLPVPLPQQLPVLASNAPRKVLRCGRRWAKSRTAMLAAIDGHGTPGVDGVKPLRGILQGADVVWMAKDYPQLKTVIWREEFVPRFKHLPYVDMNENEMRLTVQGLGSLYLRPETAITGIRGIGSKLGGVILDEAAFYDLGAALVDVVLPALLDNDGWLMVMSTTNMGDDGNAEQIVPSFFNRLCSDVMAGKRGPEWEHFHGTAFDNPRLSARAIDALIAEYTPGSASLQQEVYAALLQDVGRYYDVKKGTHLVPPADLPAAIPSWAVVWGAFDWGYGHWAVFGLFVRIGAATFLWDSVWMRQQQDPELAAGVATCLTDYGLEPGAVPIYAGHDCWSKPQARGGTGLSTADVFASAGLYLEYADIDRLNGGRAMRRALGAADEQRQAGFYVVDRPLRAGEEQTHGMSANARVFQQLQDTLPDPRDINKPRKVDATADGRGGDDGADMARYGIATPDGAATEPAPGTPLFTQLTGRPVPVPNRDGATFLETPAPAPGTIDYGALGESGWTPDAPGAATIGGPAWARSSTGDQFGE